ncbi:hypothetical protein [Salipaludibacillus agaradhaerens]|jgi:hypothetical protein|nr:hypothetical protein [Salipaludibacillus agaradhaerens]
MYTLDELLQMRKEASEEKDLPIEDFVDWGGLISLIDSHIEALKK